jgi:hypothetical protein
VLLVAVAFFLALPMTVISAAEAEPVTVGDWMRTIFATPGRKIDTGQKGIAVASPPAPPPTVQTSSEPAPPKEPVARTQVPRFFLPRETDRKQRWRRLRRRRP